MKHHQTPITTAIYNQRVTAPNAGEGVEKPTSHTLLMGM